MTSIAGMVRRDAAFRALPGWLLLGAANSGVVANVVAMVALDRSAAVPYRAIAFATWLSIALFLLFGAVRSRADEHALALPIPGPRLWLAHLLAVSGGALAIVAGTVLVLLPLQRLIAIRGDAEGGIHGVVLILVAGLVLAVALIEAIRFDLATTPLRGLPLAWRAAVLIGVGAVVVALASGSVAGSLSMLALAAVLLWHTYRSVPDALRLLPFEHRSARRGAADRPGVAACKEVAAARVWRPKLLTLLFGWIPLSLRLSWLFFTALMGAIVGGGARVLEDTTDAGAYRFFYLYLSVYMLFSAAPAMLRPLRFVDPLALPRRRIFAALVLPPALAYVAGAVVGMLYDRAPPGESAPAVAVVLAAWLVTLAVFLRSYRAGLPEWVRMAAFWAPAALLVGIPIGALVARITYRTRLFPTETAASAALADAVTSPVGALVVGVAAVAAVAGAGALAAGQFRRMEIPLRPVRYELIEVCREDR